MKNNLKIAIASGALLLSGAVCAMDFDPKVYVGAEVASNQLRVKDTAEGVSESWKKSKPSLGALVGVRLIENMGVELGYTAFSAFKHTLPAKGSTYTESVKLGTPHIDVLGYLPVSLDCDLIAAIGFGRITNSKVKVVQDSTGVIQGESKLTANTLRLALGVQYKFDESLSARLMLRNQRFGSLKADNAAVVNRKVDVTSAGLGLFYQF